MKFWEAMKALDEGKKIKRPGYLFSRNVHNPSGITTEDLNADDWEIYEDPEKTCTFQEVLKGLKEGKKYRRADWPDICFIEWRKKFISYCEPPYLQSWPGELEDFEANDWIEVK